MKEKILTGKDSKTRSRKRYVPPAASGSDEEPAKKGAKRRPTEVDRLLGPDEQSQMLEVLDHGDSCKRVTRSSRSKEHSKEQGKDVGAPPAGAPPGAGGKSPQPQPECSKAQTSRVEPNKVEHKCTSPRPREEPPVSSPPRAVENASKELCASSPLPKEPRVHLEHLSTPAPAKISDQSMDCAPSPMTPLLPKNFANRRVLVQGMRLEEEDSVPSPYGMSLPPPPSSKSVMVTDETPLLKDETCIKIDVNSSLPKEKTRNEINVSNSMPEEKTSDKMELNNSLPEEKTRNEMDVNDNLSEEKTHNEMDVNIEKTAGLDLDSLIEEIFVKNSNTPDAKQCSSENSTSIDMGSFDVTLESPIVDVDHELEEEPSIWSQRTETGKQDLPTNNRTFEEKASFPIAKDKEEEAVINSETASCADLLKDGHKLASPAGAKMEHPNKTPEKKNIVQTSTSHTNATTATESGSTMAVNSRESYPVLSNSALEDLSNNEHFTEELLFTNSQYLVIDEKCAVLTDAPQELPLDSLTTQYPIHSQMKTVTNVNIETPSSSKKLPNLGFTVPPAPCMDWVQKTLESRQRLRAIIQEISRLNAMVLRARRTMWPRQNPETDQQNNHTSMCSSNPQIVPQRLTAQLPDLSKEPEWNIS